MPPAAPEDTRGIRTDLLLLLAAAAVLFVPAAFRPLWNPDETRYSLIPLSMVTSGDWWVPRLCGVPYFEKPPLAYWMTALSFSLFGFSAWSARLMLMVFGAAGTTLTYLLGRRLAMGRAAALAGAAMMMSTVEYGALAVTLTTDMFFSVFLFGVWLSFWAVYRGGGNGWRLMLWACLGLAFLTKGPLGVLLPGIAVGTFCLAGRVNPLGLRPGWAWGPLVFVAVNLPWHWMVWSRDPRFLDFFYVRENFRAFFEGTIHHPGPVYFYLATIAGGFLPFSVLVTGGLCSAIRQALLRRGLEEEALYLLCIFASGFAFFSAASVKLHTYLLPLFPAASLLAARYWKRNWENPDPWCRWGWLLQLTALVAVAAMATTLLLGDGDDAQSMKEALAQAGDNLRGAVLIAALVAGFSFSAWAGWRRRVRWIVPALCGMMLLAFADTVDLMFRKVTGKTSEALVRAAGTMQSGDALVTTDETDYSVPLLTGRRPAIVGRVGELGFGYYVETHPGGGMPDYDPYNVTRDFVESPYLLRYEDLVPLWKSEKRVWFFIKKNHRSRFDALDIKAWTVAENQRTVLLTNREVMP